jgi:putative ABC transport system substrate-binding protein
MKRREFIRFVGGAAVAWPVSLRAQQRAIPVIGYLDGTGASALQNLSAIRAGLTDAGYTEGKDVQIEVRSAEGQYDKLPALAAELIRQKVAVIAASTPAAALAAKAATTTVPIVFSLGSDPVRDGLVAGLNRPGANITGVTFFSNLLSSKRLELLHEAAPNVTVVALLLNPTNPNVDLELRETQAAAQALGLQLIVLRASTELEINTAFAELVQAGAAALYATGDAYFSVRRDQISALAGRHMIPTSASSREHVVAGMLMSYGGNREDSSRQFGRYVARVLRGEKPSDLPVLQPTKFELVINLKTANALGLSISRELLLLADEVIE